MTQEQKAKAYDEALERARRLNVDNMLSNEAIEEIFPEVRESEDENLKNKSGYYKAGKFWKASTLWNAIKNKVPQRVPNRYILQECTWNIGTLQRFADEVKNVQEVSLDYPIILDMNGNIIDGAHRVVKAYLEGKDIDIVYIGDDEWPEPDYDEEKAVKESEDERIINQLITLVNSAGEVLLIPTNKEELVAWLNKCKESLHIQETCKKNADSFTEDERMRKELQNFLWRIANGEMNDRRTMPSAKMCQEWIAYLERQKDIEDRWVEDRGQCFWDGVEEGKMLAEKLKEQKPVPFSCGHENGKPAEWAELRSEFNINEAFENGKKEVIDHPDKYGLTKQKPVESIEGGVLTHLGKED